MGKRVLLFSLLTLGFFSVGYGQGLAGQGESRGWNVEKAKQLVAAAQYEAAIDCLDGIENGSLLRPNQKEETAYLRLVSMYELRQPRTINALREFKALYPNSSYAWQVAYIEANILFDRKEFKQALALFSEIPSNQVPTKWSVDYSFRLSLCYLFTEDYKKAYQAIQSLPSSGTEYDQAITYYKAFIAYVNHEYAPALEGFKSLEDKPLFKEVVPVYIAQIYYLQNQPTEAIAYATEYLKKTSKSDQKRELHRIIGESNYQLGRYAEALSDLDTYIKAAEKPLISSWYAYGASLYHIQSYSNAIDPLSKSIGENNLQSQTAQLLLGLCYAKTGNLRGAQMAFDAASKMTFDPQVQEEAMYNYALTVHQTASSGFDQAVGVFERFLNLFPSSKYRDKVSEYLVEVYFTTKNYRSALKSIEKISKPGPAILVAKQRILYQLGTESVVNADYRSAITSFTQAIALGGLGNTTRNEALLWRGECFYQMGQYSKAIADYQSFLKGQTDKRGDSYQAAQYGLGYSYFKIGDFSSARRAFDAIIHTTLDRQSPQYGDVLNRLGDCSLAARSFLEAENYYFMSSKVKHSMADYAMFQQAFVQGLQRKTSDKQRTLDRLLAAYPNSPLVDDALFEKGKTYLNEGRNGEAISSFERLMTKTPESPFVKKALLQIGFAYRNDGKLPLAADVYKKLIKAYPGSEEALVANSDLKSISQELDQVEEYANYIVSLGGTVQFSASEQDSLTYFAAEKLYQKGEVEKAKSAMTRYLGSYPGGVFRNSVNYNLSQMALQSGNLKEAYDYSSAILSQPDSKYTEGALLIATDYLYQLSDYNEALTYYDRLLKGATSLENRMIARMGIMRCAYGLGNYSQTIESAQRLLEENTLAPNQLAETKMLLARSYLIEKKGAQAEPLLNDLSVDTRDKFGAEARYLLAQLYYDTQRMDKAEKVLSQYIEEGTPHLYWLARAYILYSDLYVVKKKPFEAKQYLISLKNNYQEQDDIQPMIEQRLSKLK